MKKLELKSLDELVTPILASRTFDTINDVEYFIEYRYQKGASINDIVEEILKFNFYFITEGIDWPALVTGVIRQKNHQSVMTGSWDDVVLYDTELSQVRGVPSLYGRQIMFLLLIVYKWNAHPTGWIEFPRDDCFKFWDLQELPGYRKEEIMRECTARGVQLRVVGSKDPIVCFHIDWATSGGRAVCQLTNENDIKPYFWDFIE